MKKALAFVMAFAMVAGFFAAVGAEEAKAANEPMYLCGDFNGWDNSAGGAVNLTTTDDNVYTGTITIAADKTQTDLQLLATAGDWTKTAYYLVVDGKDNLSNTASTTEQGYLYFTTGRTEAKTLGISFNKTTSTLTVTDTDNICTSKPMATTISVTGSFCSYKNDGTEAKLSLQADNKTYKGTVSIPADLASTDLQLVPGNGTWDPKYDYKLDSAEGTVGNQQTIGLSGTAGDLVLTYDSETLVLTFEDADGVRATGPIEYAEVFNVVGDAALTGAAWDTTGATGTLVAGSTPGVYTLTVERVPASATPYNFKVVQDVANYGWNGPVVYKTELLTDPANTTSNMAITVSEISDVTFTVTVGTDATTLEVTVTKSALAAADVEAMIDELPEVDEVTISDKAAVQAVKDVIAGLDESVAADLDATKAAKVDALLAKIAELEAAAADTANVIIHFKNTGEWPGVNMYAFSEAGNMFGDWPGIAMTEDAENAGWYSAKFEYAEDFTVIFNGTKQTINIPIDVAEEGKTEVWIEMGDLAEEPDEFGNINYTYTLSTEAPAGYVDGDEPVVEVTLPTAGDDEDGDDETGDDETGDDETGDDETAGDEEDAATAWDDATLKVHVQMPDAEGWDKLGAYLFGTGETFGWSGGSGELTGAWPGVELLPEVNSENGWYAFGGTFADGYYMLIINNFVSDAEAAEGATKLQAADLEITDGEYWITIALDEETGKYVATTATEAPEDYDGEGLESVVEDPAGDDETGDDETGDDETGDDVTDGEDGGVDKDQPATGDNAPIAVVTMIALVAGASAVVIRKRRVA